MERQPWDFTWPDNADDTLMKAAFDEYGLVIIRNLFTPEEHHRLKTHVEVDFKKTIEEKAFFADDGKGAPIFKLNWGNVGNDVTGATARSEKVAKTFEKLLGGEVYHYYAKLILKDAKTGGANCWHQDYGYWYLNGNLWPDMGTVSIPIDNMNKENGCLEVLPKSHKLGRIDHQKMGMQNGMDPSRLDFIKDKHNLEYVELKTGDAVFFHCNLVHCAGVNRSANRRWAYMVIYNRVSNVSVIDHHYPRYTPLELLPNRAIMEAPSGLDLTNKVFYDGKPKGEQFKQAQN